MTSVVDWDVAAAVAGRLAPPGPAVDRATSARLVDELRRAAGVAAEHVAAISGLRPSDGRPPAEVSTVLVVDRARWARASTEMFAALSTGLPVSDQVPQAARLAAGIELGGVLALLAGKILGQLDPYTAAGSGAGGRLLLVAPNVLHVERALGVVPSDFRLWVALHEQTHALQFAAAPWLADHLRDRIDTLTRDLVPDGATLRRLAASPRDLRDVGLVALLSDSQREVFEEVSAIMALLEGHADVTMDEVGPQVVPTVATIRSRFERRRDAAARARGGARVLRVLLGLDLKLAQYREGARFVRGVRDEVGTEAFNAVWASPKTLPTPAEIVDPSAWVARVL
ncbi:MAG: zinc-dependent metalloprotease [Micrococcales bacterium]|nr:zinc-dependent metalloprotease [Micrococcales bacterium]